MEELDTPITRILPNTNSRFTTCKIHSVFIPFIFSGKFFKKGLRHHFEFPFVNCSIIHSFCCSEPLCLSLMVDLNSTQFDLEAVF